MYCSRCHYEYIEGTEDCPDCHEKLVPEPPEVERSGAADETGEFADWVEIGRLTSQQYADMILEALRTRGMPAIILSGAGYFGLSGQMGISSYLPAGGTYSLLVPGEFVKDADAEAETLLGDEWLKARVNKPI